MMIEKSNDMEPLGIFNNGKAFCFRLGEMLRFFLFMVSMMAASTGAARGLPSCSADTVPIQIMAPGFGGSGIDSVAKIPDALPHFRAFVTAVTERLAREKLCINSAGSMESMISAESENRSLLQFVYWRFVMHHDYIVPVMPSIGGRALPSCRIASPWIDLVVDRRQIPSSIRGIVYWNERQLLADQAMLSGAHNVPSGRAMPLEPRESDRFASEYEDREFSYPRKPTTKLLEASIPPDILWLLRRSGRNERAGIFGEDVSRAMREATEKSVEGYTKLVLALIDRCLASDGVSFHYNSIRDVDRIPGQYRIDMPTLRRSRFR
jgi:hypothetical protein